ncbi:MAG: LysR family transcriptional regulator [Oscillospiraceae bacterium]|nr:LysR family transcriptional regulator [Oscillospiraceae bacterium]
MNLQQLRFVMEVARHQSISKAAESLYVSQPFLSKAIRELESDLGIEIFKRTSKGVSPTKKGEEFLYRTRSLLNHVDEMERIYKVAPKEEYQLSLTVPISCYIAQAFVTFMQELSQKIRIKVDYQEANTMTAINRVVDYDSNIGIIRYQEDYEDYFLRYVESKELVAKPIWKYSYNLVMCRSSYLADKEEIFPEDLKNLIEISHGDPTVPALPISTAMEIKQRDASTREIVVYERQSQFELLCQIPDTYMWASPTPRTVLERYPLVQRKCSTPGAVYKDVLIWRKGYKFTAEDKLFIKKVQDMVEILENDIN